MSARNSITRAVAINRPTEALASVISFSFVVKLFTARKRTRPWTNYLSHKFIMDIALVIGFFSGYGAEN